MGPGGFSLIGRNALGRSTKPWVATALFWVGCAGTSLEPATEAGAGATAAGNGSSHGGVVAGAGGSVGGAAASIGGGTNAHGGAGSGAQAVGGTAPGGSGAGSGGSNLGGGTGNEQGGAAGDEAGASAGENGGEGTDIDCTAVGPSFHDYTLVASYPFEEPSGADVLDSGKHFAAGVIDGGRRSEGACGRGLTLDGNDSRVELQPMGEVFAEGIGVNLWVRPNVVQDGTVHLLGDGGGGLASFQLVLDDSFLVFRLSDSDTGQWHELLRSPYPLPAGAWHEVGATYDGNLGRLMIDREVVDENERIMPIEGSYNIVYVGAVMDISDCCSIVNELVGDVDEITIWRR